MKTSRLFTAMLDRAIGEPARFAVWDLPMLDSEHSVITPMNELARDLMGQFFGTTRSILDTSWARSTLRSRSETPEFGRCGARFEQRLWGE